ncbi:hypothetical protein [Polynucleobacter sp. AM-25C3]|uniref:hypothetical protein n=1 Tax=Polynucleobacter sp. AM-25C3 TaxID=1855569 RepID=UPI001C0B1638|nr:hypothetical protein [Polynucleobacter sp. AM-25C3]MBU3602324.1 hypothetical protein [Polynucleobacter sp. AM-25C3]
MRTHLFWKNLVSAQFIFVSPIAATVLELHFKNQAWIPALAVMFNFVIAVLVLRYSDRSTGWLRLLPAWKWLALFNTFLLYLMLILVTADITPPTRALILWAAFPTCLCLALIHLPGANGENS